MLWIVWFEPILAELFSLTFGEYGFIKDSEMIQAQVDLCVGQVLTSQPLARTIRAEEEEEEEPRRVADRLFGIARAMLPSDTTDAQEVVTAIHEVALMEASIAVAQYTVSVVLAAGERP